MLAGIRQRYTPRQLGFLGASIFMLLSLACILVALFTRFWLVMPGDYSLGLFGLCNGSSCEAIDRDCHVDSGDLAIAVISDCSQFNRARSTLLLAIISCVLSLLVVSCNQICCVTSCEASKVPGFFISLFSSLTVIFCIITQSSFQKATSDYCCDNGISRGFSFAFNVAAWVLGFIVLVILSWTYCFARSYLVQGQVVAHPPGMNQGAMGPGNPYGVMPYSQSGSYNQQSYQPAYNQPYQPEYNQTAQPQPGSMTQYTSGSGLPTMQMQVVPSGVAPRGEGL